MTKQFVDDMIRGMKLAGLVAKAAPWVFEGYGETQKSVRYVGLALKDDWLEIFSPQDNLLLLPQPQDNLLWLPAKQEARYCH